VHNECNHAANSAFWSMSFWIVRGRTSGLIMDTLVALSLVWVGTFMVLWYG